MHVLETESFHTTFGPKSQRKRPNLKQIADLPSLADTATQRSETYDPSNDRDLVRDDGGERDAARQPLFQKGQSKRIWNELYKVKEKR